MSRFLRFFRVAIAVIACAVGVVVPRVGYADITYPFTVTTTNLRTNTVFTFAISAKGTFYVDWGDGSPEQTIDHTGNNYPALEEISHTYTSAGTYTIGLRGLATGYSSDDLVAAISFGYLSDGEVSARNYIASVSGSLGAIFPTIGTEIPSFIGAFANCYNLTSIPGTLFSGVTGSRPHMFDFTFYNNAISEIPGNLFSGISGAAESMFQYTFAGCDNLMFLPNGLFSGVSGTANSLFSTTFDSCSSLGGYIPKDLFNFGTGGLTYNASNNMMFSMFFRTNLATSCNSYGMERYTSDFDSYFDGKVVCQMPNVNVTFSCEMPTNFPGYEIGFGNVSSNNMNVPITSGNVTFTFPDGANCNGSDYGTKLNAWTCDAAICNNRTWSSGAVFNEPWDGSAELNFHMVYEPAVFSVSLDKNRRYYDNGDQVDTSPVAGNVTTLYEKYGFGWSTNPNGPFTTNLTLSASDLPTANGFEFGGWFRQADLMPLVDAAGHVIVLPIELVENDSSPWIALWAEPSSLGTVVYLRCMDRIENYILVSGDAAFSQDFNGTSTFSANNAYGAEVQYGDNIVVPSKNACEREGYYYNQWVVSTLGDRITAGNSNTNYTWNFQGYGDYYQPWVAVYILPDWQQIQTTITLNPQNGNAGGGTTALYTIATNQDYDNKSGVYLDSARTEPVTTNANPITAPTAPTATLTFNLNDSVAEPASLLYTPKTHYYYDGNNAVSQTCGQKYGITISNDGKTFTVPAQFNGYYSDASGGTQYIEKRNLPTGESVYFITQAGIDAGLTYSADTTWYGQWEHINPIDACMIVSSLRPERSGYEFVGWWTAPSGGTQVVNPADLTIDSNTVLYAHWNLETYGFELMLYPYAAVGSDAAPGTVTSVYEMYNTGWATSINGPFSSMLTLSGAQLPTRPGYVFAGYTDKDGNAVGTYSNGVWTAPAATYTDAVYGKRFYAQWTAATYNITYNYDGGTANSSAVPAGYTRVEYIESDGNQIINTGVAGVYTRAVIDAQYTGTSNSLDMLAGYDTGAGEYVGVYNKKWVLDNGAAGLTTVSALERSNVSVVFDRDANDNDYNRATITVGGETVTVTRSTFRYGDTLKLFSGRSSGATNGFAGRIYRATIYKDNTNGVIFDGVPVRRNSDDALGIYDVVSGTFLENIGTGVFTAGADMVTLYPATYTYGIGATVYGMPVRTNSVFMGWCRDSALSTGCGMPHEIAGTETGDVTLYAKYDCVYGYSANTQTGQCELATPVFTITTTQIDPGTVFKFNLGARGTFVVDWGDGTPAQIINSNTASDTQYAHTYAAAVFDGQTTKSFTIGFSGRSVEYASANIVSAIKFFNGTLDSSGNVASDDQGNPMEGTEVYIASISGSLGAMFPVIGNGGAASNTPSFYNTFRNAKNMSQTMASLADLFNGINGAPASYMFRDTFYGCSGLTGSIPENLFGRVVNGEYYGINGAPASSMFTDTFYGCSGLTGSIPENLFGRVVNGEYYGINGAPASYMFGGTFKGCSGLTGSIPENLFGRVVNGEYYGINGAPASSMFRATFSGCSGLTGSIPENLFGRVVNGEYYGINGAPASSMFRATFNDCSGLSGEIPSYLFGHISGDAATYMFRETFRGCSGLTGDIPGNLFGGQNLTGPAQNYAFYMTFYGCRNLSGYVPVNLFGQMELPATVPSGMMSSMFANSGLFTECPCGTTEVTSSPFRTYWNSKVSCAPGLDAGQHWYNGQCTTTCSNSSIDELHVGALQAFPVLADKITTPSINVKYGDTICYVPLAIGNGGTDSLNMSYDGNVYHAERPDDVAPVGFGQRD